MNNENRVNITSFARQIKEGKMLEARDYPLLQAFSSDEEMWEWHSKVKPELYALTAVFTDKLVGTAYDSRNNRQPFGLLKLDDSEKDLSSYRVAELRDLDNMFPFVSITSYMWDTFSIVLDKEIREVEAGTSSPIMESVYRRLNVLLNLLRKNMGEDHITQFRYRDIYPFIITGSNFAATVMGGMIEVIPRVEGSVENPQRLTSIAKNSYPLVAKLAMANMDKLNFVGALQGIPLKDLVLPFPFRSRYFEIEGAGDEARLELSKEGKEQLKKSGLAWEELGIGRSSTIGCPAMVNFEDGSAVKKLWDWHVEIAEKIYPHLGP
ncbi:MAG: hypothetical protein A3E40_02640 [Candidatus Levybacteria bacterium RIFCSPHIGHO2_12_FULL_37_9]|nr:MAG: hypothetical protein A3E40_02640 [Candidatus Levybacteria bacterium RIFCSPHIGHO2_12_FULL_37_9]